MPAVLTHKAIMLLARERLVQIRDALQAKRNTPGVVHTDLEAKLLELATQAYNMMSQPPHPTTDLPGPPYVRPFGERISKFAVMGAMGPDITGFSALLAPGQAWLFDTVHKGTPDESREMVNASTCEFVMEFWRNVSTAITDEAKLKLMRAYVLGHLCHLAGDIISHPFINDVEWHENSQSLNKFHGKDEGSHDAKVAQDLFQRGGTREGAAWDAWWPKPDDVPAEFFTAYADTLEEIYKARSNRRTGSKEFTKKLEELAPPSMSEELVRDGYRLYRNGILSIGYGYGTWNWWVALLPITLPFIALPVICASLPNSKELFRDSEPGDDAGRAWLQLFSTAMAFGSLATIIYTSLLAGLSAKGVEGRTGAGIALSIISFWFGLVTLSVSADPNLSGSAKLVLFGVPTVIALIYLIIGLRDVFRDAFKFRSALSLLQTLPLAFMLAIFLSWVLFKAVKLIVGLFPGEATGGMKSLEFFLFLGVWVIICICLSIWLARLMRDAKIPEQPDPALEKPHHVRLFDDTTLFADSTIIVPTLAERFYPSGLRQLLKLWWEGPGDLFVRTDRFQLVFSFTNASGANDQIVPAPVAPMKLAEFIDLLERRVKGPGNETGKLKAAFAFPGDLDYELPSGATFADHGDAEETRADHDKEAPKFKKLAKTQDTADYVLSHAPKPAQGIRFGRNGTLNNPFGLSEDDVRKDEGNNGYSYVFDPVNVGDSATLMSFAGDFGALLCLGGASHMIRDAPAASRIYQVFRNWCLDRRRENEWRMLVAGGAFSEKGGRPDRFDPLMLQPPDKNAYRSPLAATSPAAVAEGEQTSRELGWVPLLRQWLDMTQRPTVNPLADTRLNPGNPTNHALSRGIAFLLDMSDPVAVP